MNQQSKSFIFYLLPILLFINFYIRILTINITSPDTFDYIKIAEGLPRILNSTWPIFYPLILKIINISIQDYLLSAKILSLFCLIFVIIFVRIKNFFWKEIWTLLCFFSFQRLSPISLSEVVFLPLSILVFYINYNFLANKISDKKFIIYNSLLFILLVLTKYSSIFFLIALVVFTFYLLIFYKNKFISYFKSILIIISTCMVYLIYNKITTGFYMGERLPPDVNGYHNIRLSLCQIFFNLNPLFHTRIENFMGLFPISWLVSYIFGGIFTTIWISIIFKNIKKYTEDIPIKLFLILCSSLFLIGTVYSYFTTKIDILDFRLLSGFYTFLFYTVIVSCKFYKSKFYDFILLVIALFSICPQLIHLLYN